QKKRVKLLAQATQELDREHPLFFDPCKNHPSAHVSFDEKGYIVGRSPEGKFTIDVLDLNRDEIREERIAQLGLLQKTWALLVSRVAAGYSLENFRPYLELRDPKAQFLSMRCHFIDGWSRSVKKDIAKKISEITKEILWDLRYQTPENREYLKSAK